MAETWYLRDGAGAACGPGDRESLSEAAGASVATKVLDGTGDTWNRTESPARSIAAGNWTFYFDITCGSGGGAPNRVTVLIERRNSSCAVQEEVVNEEITVSKGVTDEYSTEPVDPGQVDFADGDILTVILTQTNGGQTVTLRYNDSDPSDADSRLVHPDEAGAVEEVFEETANLAEAMSRKLALKRSAAETADVGEALSTPATLRRSLVEAANVGEALSTSRGYKRTFGEAL